jgi:hypothetical protein
VTHGAIERGPARAHVGDRFVDRREHREELHGHDRRAAHPGEVFDDALVPDGRVGYPREIAQPRFEP